MDSVMVPLRIRLLGVLARLALLCAVFPAWSSAEALRVALSVNTSSGPVTGIERDGVLEFRGIRYAQPPVGPLRWAAPQPTNAYPDNHHPERQGVSNQHTGSRHPGGENPGDRHAGQVDSPAVSCPQNAPGVFARPSVTEDCLVLNIFVPHSTDAGSTRRKARWPVIVWLHGGGLFSGSGADYDGGRLAREGHVVVVTLNYRLGALGFLSEPAITADSGGMANFGLLDQQLALRWIKRNIESFGGLPSAVTLAGQSSGATSVVAHLTAPGSAGLFQRAVIESGTRFTPLSNERARAAADAFAASVGCKDNTLQCLRNLPVQTILDHQQDVVAVTAANFFVLDRVTGPEPPLEAIGVGHFTRVPVISGLTADEQAYFLPEASTRQPLSAADYSNWVSATAGGSRAPQIVTRYPVNHYGSPSLAEIAAAQDAKRCAVLRLDRSLARFVPVYAYEFADRSAPSYFTERSYTMGAYHTAELQYLFPLFHGARGTIHALNASQDALARQMIGWWSEFARAGAPGTGGAPWPAFQPDSNTVQVIGADIAAHHDIESAYANACGFWDSLGAQ
jgi:para-nitrobenzyl esterase